ncbi:hypothetical protein PMIT1342_01842 [Prochlorococcus marinus str. MIT 1342]|uniref:hypothetical protein n=1 Tax=Prochlorococcus TaxID=1218 RepID=UPI0007B36603|nr:hypothetical protein [Prochlorococcus marinus]KZR79897.1 hypothetical protein PMIT1342_01842 [Prochlorococcus marinus str. MIT 1342]
MLRFLKKLINRKPLKESAAAPPRRWEYKVVQMVAEAPANAKDASDRLGGALSAEALKAQFPEYFAENNGRQQIQDFLNRMGQEGWEMMQIQQVGGLPLMLFKRPFAMHPQANGTKKEAGSSKPSHAPKNT